MATKSSPQPALTPEEFSGIMAAHRQWERSGGQEGRKAELAGANLQGLDLSGYDLSGLNFREANLVRVKFGEANVEGANLRAADLREADVSGARGLLAPQLAGADLAGAKLPEGFQEFAALQHVDAASSHVQKIFFLLLLVCVYCWLTIAVTTDAGLLNNFAETPLPIIGTKINLVMFYWAAPFLLLCVYLYFHLCLQRLWEALAELPAVFPDGLPLPQRIHPWLWNGLVWAYFPRLRDRRPPLLGLQKLLAIFLVWWAGPFTILALWYRYLPAHDWTITIFQLMLLTLALDGALGFSLLTRVTLQLKEKSPFHGKKLRRMAKGLSLLLVTLTIVALFFISSLGSLEGLGGLPWVHANLIEADVSLKPPQWKTGDLDMVRGAFLCGRNLRGAMAVRVFLVKADLRGAKLQRAYLTGANLQHANFVNANLQQAYLHEADLQQANLAIADLQHADLSYSNLQEVDLSSAKLQHANLELAKLQRAKLPGAYLQHAKLRGANLQHANLQCADLQRADLRKADLQHADLQGALLQHANLQGAELAHADLKRADLQNADLREADLQHADLTWAKNLKEDQVRDAYCWHLGKYSQEILKILELPGDHNENVENRNLRGYKLCGAFLISGDLSGFDLTEADLTEARLADVNLAGAILRGANLFGAELYGANLKGADLCGAKVDRGQLQSAVMDEHTKLPDNLKDLVPSKTTSK